MCSARPVAQDAPANPSADADKAPPPPARFAGLSGYGCRLLPQSAHPVHASQSTFPPVPSAASASLSPVSRLTALSRFAQSGPAGSQTLRATACARSRTNRSRGACPAPRSRRPPYRAQAGLGNKSLAVGL